MRLAALESLGTLVGLLHSPSLAAAETHNNHCSFTSFIAYEWTGNAQSGGTIHRNVVFNHNPYIERPFDARRYQSPDDLFKALKTNCVNNADGCDAVTIPHNSNLSKGQMFPPLGQTAGLNIANWRYFDQLSEIIQHKGASECFAGPGASDERCGFESLPYSSFIGKFIPALAEPPQNDTSYLRKALQEGLRFGSLNPYAFGLIGSTDTHLGTAGQTLETSYREHHNKQLDENTDIPAQAQLNPGGLAVLYAKTNSRDALFDAMKQRHAYATSGHRTGLHFFAAESMPANLCGDSEALKQLYQSANPMGTTMQAGGPPSFYISASKDPAARRPGIQALQIIKLGINKRGEIYETVYDIHSETKLSSETRGAPWPKPVSMCAVWQDPDYKPDERALYYARVLEQPSCRWNVFICERLDSSLSEHEARLCDDQPTRVQERAWSSPIWINPKQT